MKKYNFKNTQEAMEYGKSIRGKILEVKHLEKALYYKRKKWNMLHEELEEGITQHLFPKAEQILCDLAVECQLLREALEET